MVLKNWLKHKCKNPNSQRSSFTDRLLQNKIIMIIIREYRSKEEEKRGNYSVITLEAKCFNRSIGELTSVTGWFFERRGRSLWTAASNLDLRVVRWRVRNGGVSESDLRWRRKLWSLRKIENRWNFQVGEIFVAFNLKLKFLNSAWTLILHDCCRCCSACLIFCFQVKSQICCQIQSEAFFTSRYASIISINLKIITTLIRV